MNKLTDTHAHIFLEEFDDDLDEVIRKAREAGIEKIFMPNVDSSTTDRLLAVEAKYKNYCFPMMGLHPCSVKENYRDELSKVEKLLNDRQFCAVGEIGTDLYWDKSHIKEQISVFETQVEWAKSLGLPVVIHCRESIDMTIDLVSKHQDGRLKGIFHCFTGDAGQASKIMDLGLFLGIGGVVTFKNGGLDKIMPEIPLESIVLETDSPYLTPTPHRGKRNDPSYLRIIAEKVAVLKETSFNDVAETTTLNARKIFENG